jgi:predicted transcriptional regulator
MNILKKYLDQKEMTITDFSKVSSLPVPTVWRYVNGKFRPCAANALLIDEATAGAVPFRAWYPGKIGGR